MISTVLATNIAAFLLTDVCFFTQQSSLAGSLNRQRESRLDFIFRVNELHCAAKPVYGQEVLDFLTFLPGSRPSPAALSCQVEWNRSGHSSCLFAQSQNKYNYWFQSHAVSEAIYSIEKRLALLTDVIDRYVTLVFCLSFNWIYLIFHCYSVYLFQVYICNSPSGSSFNLHALLPSSSISEPQAGSVLLHAVGTSRSIHPQSSPHPV